MAKVTRIVAGCYKIVSTDGCEFKATQKEDSTEWRLTDGSDVWIDTFKTLSECKKWVGN